MMNISRNTRYEKGFLNAGKKTITTLLLSLLIIIQSSVLFAGEGMWIPLLLEKYTIEDMQDKGFRLTAEDIYNLNNNSLKDAIFIFGNGCTGGVVSDRGLLLTNHHCGYGTIQSHSSVENDLLTNGFWAMAKSEELPNPGLKATALERIEDVTVKVLQDIDPETDELERESLIEKRINRIISEMNLDSFHEAVIKPFYYGNEYYMFVYKIFRDVRLVAAPPSSIGNFGKDTDNWVWPRHTGDFSLFRIYADSSNNPAAYSPDNIPYIPGKSLEISLEGVQEHDFTMVMGYPGSTSYYLITDAIRLLNDQSLPVRIALRDRRLEIMDQYMDQSDEVRIKYASKYRSVSNYWKKWKGILWGFENSNILALKQEKEEDFQKWVSSDPDHIKQYGHLLEDMKNMYARMDEYSLLNDYANEGILAVEIFRFASDISSLIISNSGKSAEERKELQTLLINRINGFYKDYHLPVDRDIMISMLKRYRKNVPEGYHPEIFKEIDQHHRNDYQSFVTSIMKKSLFADREKLLDLAARYIDHEDDVVQEIMEDMVYETFTSFTDLFREVLPEYYYLLEVMDNYYREYMQALRQMEQEKELFPNANFTMRVAYGETHGYAPYDGVYYDYYTTIDGIIEKYKTGAEDYSLPPKLLELYMAEDYGQYVAEDGDLHTCFIATNHTSGGNSGSPVLNSRGEMIGLNFDRNWEGTMSDYYFDPNTCRNIAVDMRYVLFLIDKFGGAGYLVDEMNIIR